MRRHLLPALALLGLVFVLLEALDRGSLPSSAVAGPDGISAPASSESAPPATAPLARSSTDPGDRARREAPGSDAGTAASAPSDAPSTRLRVRVRGLHAEDRLSLSAFDGEHGFLGRAEVPGADAPGGVLTAEVPAAACLAGTVELRLAGGEVLDAAPWRAEDRPTGAVAEVELVVPANLGEPVLHDLAGELLVPQAVHELGWSPRLRVELVPRGDSVDQRRTGAGPRRLKVRAMPESEVDRRLFEVPRVAAGTYELRVTPIGYARELVVERERAPDFLHLDPGPLARALITFRGPDGDAVVPEEVRLNQGLHGTPSLRRPLEHRADWQAFECAAVPGELRLEVRDPHLGRHDLVLDLPAGWSETTIDLERRLTARLSLDGLDGVRRPTDVEVLAEGAGAVRARRLVTEYGRRGSGTRARFLDVDVAGAGAYRARVGSGADARELAFRVTEDGRTLPARWGSPDPR